MNHSPSNLVERIHAEDLSVFDDIVRWYAQDMLRLATLLLNDDEEAKDVFQDAVFKLVELVKKGRFRYRNGSIKGFLLSCTRNLCIDRLRKRKAKQPIPENTSTIDRALQIFETPASVAREKQFEAALLHALKQLTDMQRAVFVLRELKDESMADIANQLGLTKAAAWKHFYRALQKLQVILKPFQSMGDE